MKRLLFLLRVFLCGLLDVVAMIAAALLMLCSILGIVAVADAFHPANLPSVRVVPARVWFDHQRQPWASSAEVLRMDRDERFRRLLPAITILDYVCPEVADWTRERWESGHLEFEEEERGRYACWKVVQHVLCINVCLFGETDEEIAVTLAHEFRHSRQPYLPGIQCAIARLGGLRRNYELVESEAYSFEREVRRAINGGR